jgi:hypothetical protein
MSLDWLLKHGYPPGPIHLTRTHMPTMPIYYSVGNFKVEYMEMLKHRGFEIYAAYGNTGTDVRAYAAAGVPKERYSSLTLSLVLCRHHRVLYSNFIVGSNIEPSQCTEVRSTVCHHRQAI